MRIAFFGLHILLYLTAMAVLTGCPKAEVIDLSMRAVAAGDYTLVQSACEAAPSRGIDICRFKEGSPITQKLKIVAPNDNAVLESRIRVRFRDRVLERTWPRGLVEISYTELLGENVWSDNLDGPVQVLATFKYRDQKGVEKFVDALGLSFLIVLPDGYDPLPIDSGVAAFTQSCRIEYTTAGRSSIKCK